MDQAQRWSAGKGDSPRSISSGIRRLQADHDSVVDLIYHEYLLQEQLDEEPALDDFTRRFPQYAGVLADQIGLHRVLAEACEHVSQHALGRPNTGAEQDRMSKVACPVCHNQMERSADLKSDQLVCYCCGSTFRLEGDFPAGCQSGDLVRMLGRYELIETVGVGSFGMVFKARDNELDRTVAIKVPRATYLADQDGLERFLREARNVGTAASPFDRFRPRNRPRGGDPLSRQRIRAGNDAGRTPSVRAADTARSGGVGGYRGRCIITHTSMGVVHRDVKPANIMLDEMGTPRLMDFGLARRDTR